MDTSNQVNELMQAGNYVAAAERARTAVEFATNAFGPQHLDTILSLRALAEALDYAGRHAEALSVYREVLNRREKILGFDHPDTISSVNDLALVFQSLGQYGAAEPLYYRALEQSERTLGPNHWDTIVQVHNLAFLFEAQGRFREAEPLYLRALNASKNAHGDDDPVTLTIAHNLAGLLWAQGKYGDSELLFLAVLEARERVLGESDRATLMTLSDLALLYRDQGRFGESKALNERAYESVEDAFGAHHPMTVTFTNNLAGVYQDLNQMDEAEALFLRALNLSTQTLGAEHPETLTVMNNLARLFQVQSRFADAEPLWIRVLEGRERALGTEHPETILSVGNLAWFYHETGSDEKVKRLLLRVLVDSERVLGADHIARAAYLGFFADVLEDHDSNIRAAILFRKKAVNILQGTRTNMSVLEASSDAAFAQKNQEHYLKLQRLLVRAGRIVEAEKVGRMLKEREAFEWLGTRSGDEALGRMSTEFSKNESDWGARLDSWGARPNLIAMKLSSLREKQRAGEKFSKLEQAQFDGLREEYDAAYTEYKERIESWLQEVHDLNDETIKREALDLEVLFHDDLQFEVSQIGDDVAILQIVAFEESLHFFLITPYAFKHIETLIDRTELNEAIFAARRALVRDEETGRLNPNVNDHLERLYSLLIAPVSSELEDAGTRTLMLNLQGAIRYVPFSALFDGERYLTERYQTALFTPAARTTYATPGELNGATGFGVTRGHTITGLGTFSALPGVRSELETILGSNDKRGVIDGVALLDAAFTKATLMEQLSEQRPLVHIASHFHMRPGTNRDSFLLMGDGSQLTLSEIYQTAGINFRGVELLTLSACSTALGAQGDFDVDSGAGAEFEGFAVLAQRKGADAVIASLWDVSDASTSKLMASLYQGLSSGVLNKAQALRAAQHQLISDPTTNHPYYWAPFVLMGNWR